MPHNRLTRKYVPIHRAGRSNLPMRTWSNVPSRRAARGLPGRGACRERAGGTSSAVRRALRAFTSNQPGTEALCACLRDRGSSSARPRTSIRVAWCWFSTGLTKHPESQSHSVAEGFHTHDSRTSLGINIYPVTQTARNPRPRASGLSDQSFPESRPSRDGVRSPSRMLSCTNSV